MAEFQVVRNVLSVGLLVLLFTERARTRLPRSVSFLTFALGLFTATGSFKARAAKTQTFGYGAFGLIVGLLVATAGLTSAAAPLPRAVLIIDESDPSSGAPTTFSATLRATLGNFRPRVVVFGETLDLSRFAGSTRESILRTYVHEKYSDVRFGIIVAVGASAFDVVARWRSELWPDVPILFAAIDEVTAAAFKLDSQTTVSWFPTSKALLCWAARLTVIRIDGGTCENFQHWLPR
jgi:hypothetical protein